MTAERSLMIMVNIPAYLSFQLKLVYKKYLIGNDIFTPEISQCPNSVKPVSYKARVRGLILFAIAMYSIYTGGAFAQNQFENELQKKTDSLLAPVKAKDTRDELLPNDVLQNLISPSGWGGFGTYIFGGIGGDYPQPYRARPDLISFGGFCIGDPQQEVNVAFSINITEVSKLSDFSGNLVVSRQIFTGSSISAGALQLFANPNQSDSPGSTFYFAFSHAIQTLPSETDGSSKLTYTIGIGNGRFYMKSPDDIKAGRGAHGTAIFGGISY